MNINDSLLKLPPVIVRSTALPQAGLGVIRRTISCVLVSLPLLLGLRAAHAQVTLHQKPVPASEERPTGMRDAVVEPDTYAATYVPNVEYVKRSGRGLVLQILRPRDAPPMAGKQLPDGANKRPLIVYVQGSAWRKQDLYTAIPQLSDFAHAGYVVASVEYRPSSEARAPAQLQDVKAAIRFLRTHAADYGIDPARVGVWGDSSGGNLAAMVGMTAGITELSPADFPGQSDAVSAVVDFYGPADLGKMGRFPSWIDHDAADSPESSLIGKPLPSDPAAALAQSPVHYASRDRDIPPFLIVHGDSDVLVPFNQSVLLYQALQTAGKDVVFYRVAGGNHGWNFWTPSVLKLVHEFFDAKLRK